MRYLGPKFLQPTRRQRSTFDAPFASASQHFDDRHCGEDGEQGADGENCNPWIESEGGCDPDHEQDHGEHYEAQSGAGPEEVAREGDGSATTDPDRLLARRKIGATTLAYDTRCHGVRTASPTRSHAKTIAAPAGLPERLRCGMRHRSRVAAVAFVLVGALTACQSMEGGARESFSESNTCPPDRIEVRARSDVKNSDLLPRGEPPPDIKADPGRRAMWEEEQARRAKSADGCTIYEARGCGQQTLLCCFRPAKHANRVACMTRPYVNGVSRW